MTVKDIYTHAAALIGEREDDDPEQLELSVPYMNILLSEALACENSMRARDDQERLTAAPIVTSTEDAVPYHDELVRGAFPYGLAWQFLQSEDRLSLAAQYRNMFVDAVNRNYCYQMRRYR